MLSIIEVKGSWIFQSTKHNYLCLNKVMDRERSDNVLYSVQDKSDGLSQLLEKRQSNVWDTGQEE